MDLEKERKRKNIRVEMNSKKSGRDKLSCSRKTDNYKDFHRNHYYDTNFVHYFNEKPYPSGLGV